MSNNNTQLAQLKAKIEARIKEYEGDGKIWNNLDNEADKIIALESVLDDIKELEKATLAMVEFNYSDASEFDDLTEGMLMEILVYDGTTYSGLFGGVDGGEIIMLKSLKSGGTIGIHVTQIELVLVDVNEYVSTMHYAYNN